MTSTAGYASADSDRVVTPEIFYEKPFVNHSDSAHDVQKHQESSYFGAETRSVALLGVTTDSGQPLGKIPQLPGTGFDPERMKRLLGNVLNQSPFRSAS